MEQEPPNDTNKADVPVLQGSCLCGVSKYTVTGPPIQAIICHCRNCKKWSGGPFAANVWIQKDYFKLDDTSAGNVKKYEDSNTDAGKTLYRAFCTECGSAVFVDIPDYGVVSVTRGTLDVPEDIGTLDPVVEFYCCRKLPWAAVTAKTDLRQKLD